ncbi:ABC transporter ATP-binding protein [Cellulomonas bogoriensis]|uniref:ABC-type quaternary amine transporter n=1 Tax=Cellulomonas bogoriensis 69B4 = DSM 16987 TaxID=1386082 RepID=A0A0A0C125_9CELL|nr:ATP-binding cassette domain-containing protein [Cellulomonas bogoriensis]KGM13916.1 ABC transporter [Cellulomonas bogoriensis 69B4 = DSM 16987]
MAGGHPRPAAGTTPSPGDAPVIVLDGVRKEYPDGTVAVDRMDLTVARGELLVLVGASGCGKSTTLRMVNRLVEPTGGRVLLEGRDVTRTDPVALRRRIGYVIQDVGLFPHRTVAQNVATVPHLLGWPQDRTRARTTDILDLVGLDPATFARRYPHQLSGGQRQRVGVARALVADPPVLLMDEPFGAVDPGARRRLQDEFSRIQRELGTTVILVTHDVDEAVRLGDRVAVLAPGGRVEQVADPLTVLARPRTDVVADLLGRGRLTRLLAAGRLTAADLDPVSPPDGGPDAGTLPVGASLDEALAALTRADDDAVTVHDGGSVVGSIGPSGLVRALRRLLDDEVLTP